MPYCRDYFILSVFFLIFAAISAQGAVFYVSPWGTDDNSGDKNAPRKTIQEGADVLKTADSLFIPDGVYCIAEKICRAISGLPCKWITCYVLPGEKAIIVAENFVLGEEKCAYL